MSEEVAILRDYLAAKNKEKEMTDIQTTEDNTVTIEDMIAKAKQEAWQEGYNQGNNNSEIRLIRYKDQLLETVLEFMPEYDLCRSGVERFFNVMGIDHKFEHEVKVTVTFTVNGAMTQGEIDDCIDGYCRAITEAGFIEQNLSDGTVEGENYNYEVD